jgi:hypothetical protein
MKDDMSRGIPPCTCRLLHLGRNHGGPLDCMPDGKTPLPEGAFTGGPGSQIYQWETGADCPIHVHDLTTVTEKP